MHVSRPLVALLVGTVAFFALWITALKPGSGSHGQQGLPAYQSAINKACQVPGLAHAADCPPAGSATTATTSGKPAGPAGAAGAAAHASASPSTSSAPSHAHSGQSVKPATHAPPTHAAPRGGFAAVEAGLRAHKVLALLVYNPAAADDRAVHQELASVPTHGGAVVKLAVPLQDLSSYSTLLNQVPVNFSPTLVLINRARQADEIMGFADPFEIDHRVDAALGGGRRTHS